MLNTFWAIFANVGQEGEPGPEAGEPGKEATGNQPERATGTNYHR